MIGREKHWQDQCNHPAHTYVGSDDCVVMGVGLFGKIDVYVYPPRGAEAGVDGHHCCIRFGDDGGDYYSPGTLAALLKHAHAMTPYASAVEIIEKYGHVIYQPKETGKQDEKDAKEIDASLCTEAAVEYPTGPLVTLAELEALPSITSLKKVPNTCMCCGKADISKACSEIIVYRDQQGRNVLFTDARDRDDIDTVTTAHVCFDCNGKLYP